MPYKDANRDRECKKCWYEKNRVRLLNEEREWRKKNPLRQKFKRAAALANKRYPGRLTADDVAEIYEICGTVCCWCKRENLSGWEMTLEHLKPVNEKEHIVIACYSCNCARLHRTGGIRRTEDEKRQVQRDTEKRWRVRNAEKIRARQHEAYLKDQELIRLRSALRYEQNKETIRTQTNERAAKPENREIAKERSRQWRLAHPEWAKASKQVCYFQNRAAIQKKARDYYQKNKETIKARAKQRYEALKVAKAAIA